MLTGVIALGSPLAALLPSRVWAVELRVLSSAEAAALLAMIRTIAPHATLDDAAYALVVNAVDGDAAATTQAREPILRPALRASGDGFAVCRRTRASSTCGTSNPVHFFSRCGSKTLLVLYSNPIAWAHFGFQGEAFSKGGYLLRGFNDLKWLPEVPLADSGPMPIG